MGGQANSVECFPSGRLARRENDMLNRTEITNSLIDRDFSFDHRGRTIIYKLCNTSPTASMRPWGTAASAMGNGAHLKTCISKTYTRCRGGHMNLDADDSPRLCSLGADRMIIHIRSLGSQGAIQCSDGGRLCSQPTTLALNTNLLLKKRCR